MEAHASVRSYVRIRPLWSEEREGGGMPAVAAKGPDRVQAQNAASGDTEIKVTGVFGADAGQDALYDRSGMPEMAALAVNGHAATVLTYGQTGSGKTYTVYGEETTVATAGWQGGPKDGLLPRTLEDLFARLAPERPPRDGPRRQGPEDSLPPEVAVHVTAVEIYNDQIFDLLGRHAPLRTAWDNDLGYHVAGARGVPCRRATQALAAMSEALRQRRSASHALNARSNRSHTVFMVHVARPAWEFAAEGETAASSGGAAARAPFVRGSLTFVDLAGSERVALTHTTGAMVHEAGHINRSLHALGQTLQALVGEHKAGTLPLPASGGRRQARQRRRAAQGGGVRAVRLQRGPAATSRGADGSAARLVAALGGRVPFREATLTKVLLESLAGRGVTALFACVSPAAGHGSESRRTLRFAVDAMRLRTRPVPHLTERDSLVRSLRCEIARLRAENEALKETGTPPPAAALPALLDTGQAPAGADRRGDGGGCGRRSSKRREGVTSEALETVGDFGSLLTEIRRVMSSEGAGGAEGREDAAEAADTAAVGALAQESSGPALPPSPTFGPARSSRRRRRTASRRPRTQKTRGSASVGALGLAYGVQLDPGDPAPAPERRSTFTRAESSAVGSLPRVVPRSRTRRARPESRAHTQRSRRTPVSAATTRQRVASEGAGRDGGDRGREEALEAHLRALTGSALNQSLSSGPRHSGEAGTGSRRAAVPSSPLRSPVRSPKGGSASPSRAGAPYNDSDPWPRRDDALEESLLSASHVPAPVSLASMLGERAGSLFDDPKARERARRKWRKVEKQHGRVRKETMEWLSKQREARLV